MAAYTAGAFTVERIAAEIGDTPGRDEVRLALTRPVGADRLGSRIACLVE